MEKGHEIATEISVTVNIQKRADLLILLLLHPHIFLITFINIFFFFFLLLIKFIIVVVRPPLLLRRGFKRGRDGAFLRDCRCIRTSVFFNVVRVIRSFRRLFAKEGMGWW